MRTHWRLAKNAAANLVRGGTAGIISLFLPAILVRHMSQLNYSVWVLVLQVAAYSSYLDFGLQTAVGRFIATTHETQDSDLRDSVFSTAFIGLAVAGFLAVAALLVTSYFAGSIFPTVPLALLPSMQKALLIVGSSIALGLPTSAWSGVFLGLQRNEIVAAVTGVSRLISALGLILAAIHGASLIVMAAVVASINLLSYAVLYLMVKRCTEVSFRIASIRRSVGRDLVGYCFSLTIWSFSTLLISGLDLLLVGRFELEALIPYALASSLVNFIAGIQSAIFSATMPHAAGLHARGESIALGSMVISTTRLAVLILTLSGLPLLIYGSLFFKLWVGERYSRSGYVLLVVLMAANMIRLAGLPYSIALVASARQRSVVLSPLLEAFTNVLTSIVLGLKFGAIGVAIGTLVGGIVGMSGHILYNIPRTQKDVSFSLGRYLRSSIALPTLAASPLILFAAYASKKLQPNLLAFVGSMALTLILMAALFPSVANFRKLIPVIRSRLAP